MMASLTILKLVGVCTRLDVHPMRLKKYTLFRAMGTYHILSQESVSANPSIYRSVILIYLFMFIMLCIIISENF